MDHRLRCDALPAPTRAVAQRVGRRADRAAADRSACGARWGCRRRRTPRSTQRGAAERADPARSIATPACCTTRWTSARCGAPRRPGAARLAVGSALFGLLRADDLIPAYRLSAASRLPGRPDAGRALAAGARTGAGGDRGAELVVDLRSGSYAALGRVPGAVTVEVVAERSDGRRTVVSHFNKAPKGRLAPGAGQSPGRSRPTPRGVAAGRPPAPGLRIDRARGRRTWTSSSPPDAGVGGPTPPGWGGRQPAGVASGDSPGWGRARPPGWAARAERGGRAGQAGGNRGAVACRPPSGT